jgi:hypothetical protein
MRRYGSFLVILIVGVALGLLAGLFFDSETKVVPTEPSTSDPLSPVLSQTEEGAVTAAANFALLSAHDSLATPEALAQASSRLVAPSWREQAAEQARAGSEFLTESYGDAADVSGAVLGYEVVEFSPDATVVRLWVVSVISGSADIDSVDSWSIATIELQWFEQGWLVTGTESSSGPSPGDQTDGADLDEVSGFKEFQGAPSP